MFNDAEVMRSSGQVPGNAAQMQPSRGVLLGPPQLPGRMRAQRTGQGTPPALTAAGEPGQGKENLPAPGLATKRSRGRGEAASFLSAGTARMSRRQTCGPFAPPRPVFGATSCSIPGGDHRPERPIARTPVEPRGRAHQCKQQEEPHCPLPIPRRKALTPPLVAHAASCRPTGAPCSRHRAPLRQWLLPDRSRPRH